MGKVDLAIAKLHLRIDADVTEEDALIEAWIKAAYLAIEGKIFRKVFDTGAVIPEADPSGIVTDDALNSAALLILGHLYVNREAVAPGQTTPIPLGAEWLLDGYINTAQGY